MELIDRVGRPLIEGLSASGSFNSTLKLVRVRKLYVYKPLLKGRQCVKPVNRSLNVQVVKLTAIYSTTNKVIIAFFLCPKPVIHLCASQYILTRNLHVVYKNLCPCDNRLFMKNTDLDIIIEIMIMKYDF